MEGATTYSCFSFYCPFCVDITLWENKGNQSKCQQCTTLGTNYMDTCSRCQKDSTFLFVRVCSVLNALAPTSRSACCLPNNAFNANDKLNGKAQLVLKYAPSARLYNLLKRNCSVRTAKGLVTNPRWWMATWPVRCVRFKVWFKQISRRKRRLR